MRAWNAAFRRIDMRVKGAERGLVAKRSLDGGFNRPVRRRWGCRPEDFVLGDWERRKGTPAVRG